MFRQSCKLSSRIVSALIPVRAQNQIGFFSSYKTTRPTALITEANQYLKNEQYADAINILNKLLKYQPGNAKLLSNRGWALHQKGEPDAALHSFNLAIASNPRCAPAFLNKGNVLFEQQRFKEAIANYDQAIQLNKSLVNAYINKALAYRKLGQNDQAQLQLEHVIRLDPKNTRAQFYVNLLSLQLSSSDMTSVSSLKWSR